MAANERDRSISGEVARLFSRQGDSMYGGEAVTQREHALQAAFLAEQEAAAPGLIVAALLHDIGHLLHGLPEDAPDQGIDDRHEDLAARWLQRRFPAEVVEPVRLHVAAKRYLCTVDPSYEQTLSEPSIVSLQLQGGRMSAEEVANFEHLPVFEWAVRVRKWDDAAKIVNQPTPELSHFLAYVEQVTA